MNLYGGMHFYNLSMWLKDIFTGKISHERVIVNSPLSFVEHFKEPAWRRILYPVTVGEFLKKNANTTSHYSRKMYSIPSVNGSTRINMLEGTPRKKLSLYATLSKSNLFIFDLVGVSPQGAEEIYATVKQEIENGGSAILLDYSPDMKDNCTRYLEIEVRNMIKLDTAEFILKK